MRNYKSILPIFAIVVISISSFIIIKAFKKIDKRIINIEGAILSKNDNIDPQGSPVNTQREILTRLDFINLIDRNLKILEIGPYYKPALKGKNVKYFDVLDKEQLIKKAQSERLEISRIPNVDYVEPNGDMNIIKERFDIIYSSHNIEHQVDLIRHLNQVEKLLNEGGKFYIVIPDKRYCFDHFICQTPLSDVIATYEENYKVHSLQTVLSKCETGHSDAKRHWQGEHGEIGNKDLQCYKNMLAHFQSSNGGYIDSHKWRMTPNNFEFIINSLNELSFITLKIEKIYTTPINAQEFNAILYKPMKSII